MSRAGNKAFRGCDVKSVSFTEFVFIGPGKSNPTVSEHPSSDVRQFAGNAAKLICPRVEDDKIQIDSQLTNHPNKKAALKSVEKLAGELVCGDCRYATMTPVEVSIARTDFARAEANRMEAYQALLEGYDEVNRISAERGLPPSLPGSVASSD